MDIGICMVRLKIQAPESTLNAVPATPGTSPPRHIIDASLAGMHVNHIRRHSIRWRVSGDGGRGPVMYDPEILLYLGRTPSIRSGDDVSPVCSVQIEFSPDHADVAVAPKPNRV